MSRVREQQIAGQVVKQEAGAGQRCGLVALVGPTNAGKSSLLNRLVGEELALVSQKAQTTRFPIRGVTSEGESQVIFLDVAGFLRRPRRLLEAAMRRSAEDSLFESDIAVLVLDIARHTRGEDYGAVRKLAGHRHAVLVLNKVDIADKVKVFERTAAFTGTSLTETPVAETQAKTQDETQNETQSEMDKSETDIKTEFKKVFMVSAKTGSGVEDLRAYLLSAVPKGPWHFAADDKGGIAPPLAWAEITRGVIYERLHEELPYAIAVETESYEGSAGGAKSDGLVIRQVIHVETESQKKIVVGREGARIGELRELAEGILRERLGGRVRLHLFVRVTPRWAEDTSLMGRIFPILPT